MKQRIKKYGTWLLLLALTASLAGNIYLFLSAFTNAQDIWHIDFEDANSRENYITVHKIKEAREMTGADGSGIKVGILDWCFGYDEHKELYTGGEDFTGDTELQEIYKSQSEHGYWMAHTLHEIAPGVEIYALGTNVCGLEEEYVESLVRAIDWAITQKIDILTYSQAAVRGKNRDIFDAAIDRAAQAGIITTFIHTDHPHNILPGGLFDEPEIGLSRRSDINIFTYDYNMILMNNYRDYLSCLEKGKEVNEKDSLYLSISSTSVVTAGMIAMMMEIKPDMTPDDYREILIRTSETYSYNGYTASRVVNLEAAMRELYQADGGI